MTGLPSANGTIATIAVGDGQSNRDGRKCRITEIGFQGEIRNAPGATGNGAATVFMTWVLDTQCNGTAAIWSDIWAYQNGSQQLMNLANEGRFKILSKQVYKLNATAGVAGAYNNAVIPVDWRKKVSIPIEYDNTAASTGVIATIKRNNVMCFISSNAGGTGVTSVVGVIRTRFVG